jgi:hypothetical protein
MADDDDTGAVENDQCRNFPLAECTNSGAPRVLDAIMQGSTILRHNQLVCPKLSVSILNLDLAADDPGPDLES